VTKPERPASTGSPEQKPAPAPADVSPNPNIQPPKFMWLEKSYSPGKPKSDDSGPGAKKSD
jgi:hypothetical protein